MRPFGIKTCTCTWDYMMRERERGREGGREGGKEEGRERERERGEREREGGGREEGEEGNVVIYNYQLSQTRFNL